MVLVQKLFLKIKQEKAQRRAHLKACFEVGAGYGCGCNVLEP